MTKIFLTISKSKTYLRIIHTEAEKVGALPASLLPSSFLLAEELEVDDMMLSQIRDEAFRFAQNKLLDYLAMAERTNHDCLQYLKKWYVSDDNTRKLLQYAMDKKYLSEERYTEFFIEDAILAKKSPEEIKYKLKLKRIPLALIQEKLKTLYPKDALKNNLEEIIDQAVYRGDKNDLKKLYEKIAALLYRKGYRYEDFREMLYQKIYRNTEE